jgi:hypothetical protein
MVKSVELLKVELLKVELLKVEPLKNRAILNKAPWYFRCYRFSMPYQPPFQLTPLIVNTISTISRNLGRFDRHRFSHSPQLRKQNRIRTLHSTLAIEGNTLSPAQITAIIDGKRVLSMFHHQLNKSLS